ncbi:MAG: hypothetical protein CYG61_02340 [Actinobacteria bacterium]|nr:MAG: hypothetical protein CYG61_02340 [Actinomycetota bacterium]
MLGVWFGALSPGARRPPRPHRRRNEPRRKPPRSGRGWRRLAPRQRKECGCRARGPWTHDGPDDSDGRPKRREPLSAGSGPLDLRFVVSAPGIGGLPPTSAEVAVIGRSNVGKSSLVNALANRAQLAQVSKTPGRTRLLNLFAVTSGGTVVDLPGYGYAAVSKSTMSAWPKMIEGYLSSRENLVMVVVLVDGEIGPTELDVGMLDWIRDHDVPHTVVATKHDKVKSSHRVRRKKELAAGCTVDAGDVLWVSAATGTGISVLRGRVRTWLST